MKALLVTVHHLYHVNAKALPRAENHGNLRQRLQIRIEKSTPNIPPSLNFYRCQSTSTIQQAEEEMKREKLNFVYIIYCFTITLVFPFSLRCNSAGAFFSLILRSRKCGNIHTCFQKFVHNPTTAFMWWRKLSKLIFFTVFSH